MSNASIYEIEYLGDYVEEWRKNRHEGNRSSKHKTGMPGLDNYLGGGYGIHNDFEILAIYGAPGSGKSYFAMHMLLKQIEDHTKIAAMWLEDSVQTILERLREIKGDKYIDEHITGNKELELVPKAARKDLWDFQTILKWIEHKIVNQKCEIILIDHWQFLIENSDKSEVRSYQEDMNDQRVFIKKLHGIIEEHKVTLIFISHISKDQSQKGVFKMLGTSGLGGVATKAIEVSSSKEGAMTVELTKSRHTRNQIGNPMSVDLHRNSFGGADVFNS